MKLVVVVALLMLLVSAGRVVSTYSVLNDTIDENDHIEAGLEYWQLGRYRYETQHPPLARLAVSVLPYFFSDLRLGEERILLGQESRKALDAPRRLHETYLWAGAWQQGTPEFYWRTLSLARAGNLLFLALLLLAVAGWAWELFGSSAAVAAVVLAGFSPTLLGHGGLATLDIGLAATVVAAAYAFWRWMEQPTLARAAWAGFATALAVTTKFSALVFLPPIFLAYLLLGRTTLPPSRSLVRQLAVAAVVTAGAVWATYGFSFGGIAAPGEVYVSPHEQATPSGPARTLAGLLGSAPIPAPALAQGLIDVLAHNEQGHPAYLLGTWSKSGRIAYFPVALAVKTTLPLLALAGWGLYLGLRSDRLRHRTLVVLTPLVAVLAIAMASDINIGVRHILPIYPWMAMLGGVVFCGVTLSSLKRPAKAVAAALVLWHGVESLAAGPDQLAYFNQIARGRETKILLDSNLDWGQDLARLGRWMQRENVPAVLLRYFGDARPELLGVNTFPLPAGHPDAGWFAISANFLYGMEGAPAPLRALAQRVPEARVGRSIFVYRIDPAELPQLVPPWFFEQYDQTPPPAEYAP